MPEDPGWAGAWAGWSVVVPQYGFARLRRRREAGEITTLTMVRQAFVGLLLLLALTTGMCLFVTLSSDGVPNTGAVVAVVVVAAMGTVVFRLIEHPLTCASEATLADSYRRRFFLRMASANSAVLLTFVAGVYSGASWTIAFAAVFALIGYTRAIPSVKAIVREDEALATGGGCRWSLLRALQMRTPGSGSRAD